MFQTIFDSILNGLKFLINLTRKEFAVVLYSLLLGGAVVITISTVKQNNKLLKENRDCESVANIIVNHVKDSLNNRVDSLKGVINYMTYEKQVEKNKDLQNQLDEIKKVQKNANSVIKTNQQIIQGIKK